MHFRVSQCSHANVNARLFVFSRETALLPAGILLYVTVPSPQIITGLKYNLCPMLKVSDMRSVLIPVNLKLRPSGIFKRELGSTYLLFKPSVSEAKRIRSGRKNSSEAEESKESSKSCSLFGLCPRLFIVINWI